MPRAERRNHGADFFVAQHLVVAGLLDVEDLALQRQDRLEAAIAALLGGAACALTLDQVEFAASGLRSEQSASLPGRPPPSSAPLRRVRSRALRAASRARAASMALLMILLGDRRVLLEEHAQALVDKRLHDAGDVGVELALGLAFKLRLRQLDADDCDKAFADIVAAKVLLHIFEQAELTGRWR